MNTIRVKIADLTPHPNNPRTHGEKQIVEMVRSLQKFGQIRPVVIDEGRMILAGHGVTLAMQRLGWEECDALPMDGLTQSEKKKLMLADNKIAELGHNDYDMIMEIVRTLDDVDIPGFDADVLERLVGDVDKALDSFGTMTPPPQTERSFFDAPPAGTPEPRADAPAVAAVPGSEPNPSPATDREDRTCCPHCGGKLPW